MVDKKNRKKTLTISSALTKKIDSSAYKKDGKKSFSIEKKRSFRPPRGTFRPDPKLEAKNKHNNKKNFERKFVEQKATRDFIKKDDKPTGKNKLKLKGPIDKREFKLTVSRALNVEEIEIKQRSLASVKRARLKEKRSNPEIQEKKNLKK